MNDVVSHSGDANHRVLAQQERPKPPAPDRGLTAKQQTVLERVQHKADVIQDVAFPAAMAAAIPVAEDIGTAAFKVYLDGLRKQAGNPTDPIEIMLIEQLALAHHRIAQLHAQAERAKSVEESKVFAMAAVRLTGELRRLALALNQYRQPLPRRQFTLIKQQNVSRDGQQQVAYLDRGNEFPSQVPSGIGNSEQGSKRLGHAPQTAFIPESQTPGSRPAEPAPAWPTNAGRATAAAVVGPPEPAMEVFDGAQDGGGQGQGGSKRSMAAER